MTEFWRFVMRKVLANDPMLCLLPHGGLPLLECEPHRRGAWICTLTSRFSFLFHPAVLLAVLASAATIVTLFMAAHHMHNDCNENGCDHDHQHNIDRIHSNHHTSSAR